MSNLNKYLEEIKKNVSSLNDDELKFLISKYKSNEYLHNDEWWEKYSKTASKCVEIHIEDEDRNDPSISEFLDQVKMYDFYLSHGVLDNCSEDKKEFIKLIDKVGY